MGERRRLEVEADDRLPPGAWCAVVHRGRAAVEMRHGTAVECGDDEIFEGVWSSPFGDGRMWDAPVRMGTGLAVRDGDIVVTAPSHAYRAVAIGRQDDRLVISNSLAFVLAITGARPRVEVSRYHAQLFRSGQLPSREVTIRFPPRLAVRLLYLDRCVVDDELRLTRQRIDTRTPPRALTDFAAYREHLTDVTAALTANAVDGGRRAPFGLLASISRGYDSGASAAICRTAGWEEAVTLSGGDDDPDDGTVVGETLGYRVHRHDVDAWETANPWPEAEFLAWCGPTALARLAGFEPRVRHRVLSLGSYGDYVWGEPSTVVEPRFDKPFDLVPGVEALGEWELRNGSVAYHLPTIGAEDARAVARLGESPAMDPWRLRRRYDRPLPRRILEEAGVARDAFGVVKHQGSHIHAPYEMTDESRADFRRWLDEHRMPLRATARDMFVRPAKVAHARVPDTVRDVAGRLVRPITGGRRLRPTWEQGHLFHWAMAHVLPRYTLD